MFTKTDAYLQDDRGNRAYFNYFGNETAAEEALKSLEDCDDCINCSRCSGCSGCSRCSRCSGCSGCSRCSGCSGCSRCSRCSGCSGCSDCSDCSGCSRCSRCSRCSGCSDCSDCSDCSHVTYLYDKTDLRGYPSASATLGAPPIPKIENIHQAVYAAASNPKALEMGSWHTCETTHCRAGWVTHLAGEAGRDLENFHNTELAAMLIYRESSPIGVSPWRFYQGADDALADMKRCAEEEAAAE